MSRFRISTPLLLAILAPTAFSQNLTGLRIEGPDRVVEETVTLYRVFAEFDNGREYEVTLNAALSVEPGLFASINRFGEFETFDIQGDQSETIRAVYRFGEQEEAASLDVTIEAVAFPRLVVDRVLPCGRIFARPFLFGRDQQDMVRVFDRSGSVFAIWLENGVYDSQGSSAFDLQGNYFVGQWNSGTVLVISPGGELIRTISGSGLRGAQGTALTPSGDMAVCSYLSDSIRFFDLEGNFLSNLAHAGTEDPHAIAYDRVGRLYVASRNNARGRIAVFDEELNFVEYWGDGLFTPDPLDLTFDRSGFLYVSTRESGVLKFDRSGELVDVISHDDLSAFGLAFDEEERLYVSNALDFEIFVFTKEGALLERIRLDMDPPPEDPYQLYGIDLESGVAQDCNENGTADTCDVANGVSEDRNANRVPDECEVRACCVGGACSLMLQEDCDALGCARAPQWQCDGDVDGDGQVNPVDVGQVQSNFGNTNEQAMCNYDVDCDGQINPVDSGIVQSLMGTCDPPRDSCGTGTWFPEDTCESVECP